MLVHLHARAEHFSGKAPALALIIGRGGHRGGVDVVGSFHKVGTKEEGKWSLSSRTLSARVVVGLYLEEDKRQLTTNCITIAQILWFGHIEKFRT